jgi:hypothetical protein
MTNAQIIFNAAQALAEEGKIGYTGREFKAVDADGNEMVVRETEPIHTHQTWKQLGYQVQKGQKAVAAILIWKHTVKVDKETGGEDAKMFMKTAHFFSMAQVQAVGQ